MHPSAPSSSLPSNSSGIKVIIIGCGIAALGCAIACTQKGHKVVVVFQKSDSECNSELKSLADDVVTPTPKVGRFVERWGLGEKLHSLRRIPNVLHLGGVQAQPLPNPEHDSDSSYVYITQLHDLLLAHAQSIGVEMRTGCNVIAYRQNGVVRKAGVILDNGERVEGDLLVCVGNFEREGALETKVFSSELNNPSFVDARDYGDDISERRLFKNKEDIAFPCTGSDIHWHFDSSGQSQSGKAFTHSDRLSTADMHMVAHASTSVSSSLKAQSTSFVDYDPLLPTWTDGRLMIIGSGGSLVSMNAHDTSQANTRDHGDDISKRRLFDNKEDTGYPWTTGSDVHFDTSGQSQSGKAFTHSDEAANRLSTADMHMVGRAVKLSSSSSSKVQSTSSDPLLPTWTDGRLLIIGGSLVSTNAYDSSQVIEDGVMLAVTLNLAGKHNVPLAVKAWERIRHHHRVHLINKSTRGKRRTSCDATSTLGGDKQGWRWWHHTSDTQELEDAYDAEKDAYELYSEVMLSLLEEAAVAERRGGKCAPVAWL